MRRLSFLTISLLITMLILATGVMISGAIAAPPTPPIQGVDPPQRGGFSTWRVDSKAELIELYLADDQLANRLVSWGCMGKTYDEVFEYLDHLVDGVLVTDYRGPVWAFNKTRGAFTVNQHLKPGQKVLLDHRGIPIVKIPCGNPIGMEFPLPDVPEPIVYIKEITAPLAVISIRQIRIASPNRPVYLGGNYQGSITDQPGTWLIGWSKTKHRPAPLITCDPDEGPTDQPPVPPSICTR